MLVPALMHLIGPANWWYPRWLDRITPHVSVEPEDDGWEDEPGGEPDGEREFAQV